MSFYSCCVWFGGSAAVSNGAERERSQRKTDNERDRERGEGER